MTEHHLIAMDEHTPRQIEWLWPGRIPCGGISLFDGNPGANKSSLLYDIAARVTTGRSMPDCNAACPAGAVILLQAEDALDTIQRNLEAAGADLAKIFLCDKSLSSAGGILTLPDDLDFLTTEIEQRKPRLLIIDPVPAFISVNLNNDQAVRQVTQPLAALAERTGVAIVLVRHLTKSGGANPLYRGAGSIALIGAARSGLLVAADPGNPEHRVLAQTKSSLAAPVSSLSFRPVSKGNGVAIEWLGQSDYSAAQLLEADRSHSRRELEEAIFVLYSILADGPVPAKEAKRLAAAAGISDRTSRRAKEVLGVASKRKGFGRGSSFSWVLPEQHVVVDRLKDRELDRLLDDLCHGPDSEHDVIQGDHDPATGKTTHKDGRRPDEDGPGTVPSCPSE